MELRDSDPPSKSFVRSHANHYINNSYNYYVYMKNLIMNNLRLVITIICFLITLYIQHIENMNKLQELAPDWKIGLSDHSEGIVASLVAVGLGAKFIEKHFTLDKAMPGPDHKASITPEELKELCVGVHKRKK